MNATKLRDQLDTLLDQLVEAERDEATEEGAQADADLLYQALVQRLRDAIDEAADPNVEPADRASADWLNGFAYALDMVMDQLPPSDAVRDEHPVPTI